MTSPKEIAEKIILECPKEGPVAQVWLEHLLIATFDEVEDEALTSYIKDNHIPHEMIRKEVEAKCDAEWQVALKVERLASRAEAYEECAKRVCESCRKVLNDCRR